MKHNSAILDLSTLSYTWINFYIFYQLSIPKYDNSTSKSITFIKYCKFSQKLCLQFLYFQQKIFSTFTNNTIRSNCDFYLWRNLLVHMLDICYIAYYFARCGLCCFMSCLVVGRGDGDCAWCRCVGVGWRPPVDIFLHSLSPVEWERPHWGHQRASSNITTGRSRTGQPHQYRIEILFHFSCLFYFISMNIFMNI